MQSLLNVFFFQPFGSHNANLGSLKNRQKRQSHSPDVNHNTSSSTIWKSPGASYWDSFPKPDQTYHWDSSQKPFDSECNVLSHRVTLPKSVLETIGHGLASFYITKGSYFSLTLNTFHTLSQCYHSNFKQASVGWQGLC